MEDPKENAEPPEQALKIEREKLDEIGKAADAADQDLHPPAPVLDHACDGGVF